MPPALRPCRRKPPRPYRHGVDNKAGVTEYVEVGASRYLYTKYAINSRTFMKQNQGLEDEGRALCMSFHGGLQLIRHAGAAFPGRAYEKFSSSIFWHYMYDTCMELYMPCLIRHAGAALSGRAYETKSGRILWRGKPARYTTTVLTRCAAKIDHLLVVPRAPPRTALIQYSYVDCCIPGMRHPSGCLATV